MNYFGKILTGFALTLAVLTGSLAVGAGAAHAAAVPTESQLWAGMSEASVTGNRYNSFSVKIEGADGPAPAGVSEHFETYDCHGKLTAKVDHTFDGSDASSAASVDYNAGSVDWLGQTVYVDGTAPGGPIAWTITIHTPGYDDYTFGGTYSAAGTSCQNSTTTQPPAHRNPVTHWGVKRGIAKHGRRVRVTKPSVVTGARISYTWRINGHVVSHQHSLRLKRVWKHKTVRVTVRVTKAHYDTKTRTYRFGRVK